MKLTLMGLAIVALVSAQEDELRISKDVSKNIGLGLCHGFTLEACLPPRIEADSAMWPCETNADCAGVTPPDKENSGVFCCPSKCAGMRCTEFTPNDQECPSYNPVLLFATCSTIGYECTPGCRCCLDAGSCTRKCLE